MIRVSAIVPVYNGAATVGRAIESALDQKFEGLEVIVVDDGSTDSTGERLKQWGDRIRVVRQANSGPSSARNHGVRVAAGEYLAFLDADDEWMPGKLSKMIGALESARGAALAYSNFVSENEAGREQKDSLVRADCDHAPSMGEMLTHWWPILTSAVVMPREIFDRCGGFSTEFCAAGYEDPYLWLLARELGDFVYVERPLVIYRAQAIPERMEKYQPGAATFIKLVQRRYGSAARLLIREVIKGQVTVLGYQGLLAMRRGDRKQARRAFVLALRADPLHLRSALRLLRTFLPPVIARRLTGRTRLPRRRRLTGQQ